jgi:anti-sigma regulatory factor (Ser/Thr protein kinase)
LTLTLRSEPESAALARRRLEEFLDATDIDADAVLLAVTEAVANAVLHAYRGERDGEIEVVATHDRDGLTVVVADRGIGMSPNPASRGLGFGLPVIGAYADSFRVEPVRGGGTRVTMRFGRSAAEPDPGGPR